MSIYCPFSEALGIDSGGQSILNYSDDGVHTGLKGIKLGPQSKEHLEKRSKSISLAKTGKKRSQWEREAMTEWFSRKWYVKCPDGSVTIVSSLRIFCEENNLSYDCMYATYRGKQKRHKGYSLLSNEKTKNDK